MSLDVWLEIEGASMAADTERCVPVREGGRAKLITYAEWYERFPDGEPVVLRHAGDDNTVWHGNITHNLNNMAEEAGIYQYLWRPEELDITTAEQLIEPLQAGLSLLQSDPDRFRAFDPPNGWGDYEGLVDFVSEYLAACERYPAAKIRVWR